MVTERAFVSNAVRGMLISLGFGLIVLVAATNNIIVAVLSLLSIAGIVVSVMGVMSIADWELGVAESITIVVVIGKIYNHHPIIIVFLIFFYYFRVKY